MVDALPRATSAPGSVYFDSVDGERAREVLNRFYHPASIGADLELGAELIQLGPLTVGHLTFARSATLEVAEAGAYHVTLPTAGLVRMRRGGRELTATPATALAFRPGDRIRLRHEPNSAELGVRIESWALEAELAGLLGHPIEGPIDLPPAFDLTEGPAHSWSRLIRLLRDELEHESSLIYEPVIAEQLCGSVLSGLLLSVPHRYHEELVTPSAAGPPRPIRRAMAAITDEPEYAFTVGELAAIAGISVRSLQSGFRRHVGCAPRAYLQDVRLTRAHEALRHGDPAAVTVAEVAHRWGFAHLGRFASAYRKRFGVSPSETLRAGNT
ncbi:AraC-like DNA-binding protein [Actinoplanes campanulatus]|uniref:AraC-like DNA-binding protein n=1 Tax=Actinoplanes campanulatus TaxID=113559 RepID=A0A7W5AC96_9ACTN|nr:AraC family transcriptional regulator [Actinoplanes campanulatus]MBB3093320.1 AraC-like DNA-binding protein [Actinoplanes campanulatus]GGN02750.1 transcriptional regulator [Actinoplanes campanulatus]GID33585.1 transcriptional regulator [Actinoplanes campanulatus]